MGEAPAPGRRFTPARVIENMALRKFCGEKYLCETFNNLEDTVIDSYSVYKHTSPEGKVYIGVTRQDPQARWCGGFGYASNLYFLTDIMAYGWLNFQHEVLADGLQEEQAFEMEAELIAHHNSTNPLFGYNLNAGSARTPKKELLAKARLEMKLASGAIQTCNTYQKKHSQRPVRCVETGDVFPSLSSAARYIHTDKTSLRKQILKGQRCHGYHWKYVTDNEEEHSA